VFRRWRQSARCGKNRSVLWGERGAHLKAASTSVQDDRDDDIAVP
jgi:hypothetical protein